MVVFAKAGLMFTNQTGGLGAFPFLEIGGQYVLTPYMQMILLRQDLTFSSAASRSKSLRSLLAMITRSSVSLSCLAFASGSHLSFAVFGDSGNFSPTFTINGPDVF